MDSFKYVVAIVAPEFVQSLENKLRSIGVGGITLTRVRGFGQYKNFYARDWLTDHVKVEIFAAESAVDGLVKALVASAGFDVPGSGIVAVVPVDEFLHLNQRIESLPGQLA
jgi:nitrogen regulatory protein P-II 1